METKTKRIFAAIIAFCMLTVILPMTVIAENPYEGSCGQNGGNLNWSYNETTKTLTISGTGNMSNYYSSGTAGGRAPWVNSKIKDEIETVVISEGAESIGEYAFFECTGLKNVTIPSTVKTINEGAFYKCSGLTSPQPEKSDDEIVDSITIPYGVTSIGDEVFAHCTGLKKVTIPGSVKSIGERAFSDCHISTEESEDGTERGLEKVVIENGTETIGKEAFNGCKKLNDIILPDSVTSIGENAFQYTGLYYEWFDGNEDVLYINNH
ncbi:MAG: leucine-rich repeat domain-containing protein, partial [Clostridia bacterium]|nr:leucine-rich repeat domain-containing protein [Clostridia bacterium]